jgi:hypothetical protein
VKDFRDSATAISAISANIVVMDEVRVGATAKYSDFVADQMPHGPI